MHGGVGCDGMDAGKQCFLGVEICVYNIVGEKGCITFDQNMIDNPATYFVLDNKI